MNSRINLNHTGWTMWPVLAAALLGVAILPTLTLAQANQANQANQPTGQPSSPTQQDALLDQPDVVSQLELAGENRAELVRAIEGVPAKHRAALRFLILNMPEYDLKNLTADFLLTNIRLAYEARERAPWTIPDEIFFNDVLPYGNIDEPRDPWRAEMFELCWPIVKDCQTPGEAAQKLNATVFQQLSVKYSTKRKRANQSPQESIDQGLASCTGLSIILSDACRSVGVPARLAGIPSWKNKQGNHTWVEVWDQGWHFTGAAEPDAKGLNRAWFQADAALADPNSEMHSIYATSFRKTETVFPMVWSPAKRVYAENVTARYIPNDNQPQKESVQAMIRVWNADKSNREVVEVIVSQDDDQSKSFTGQTKAGTADMNDMLSFELLPNTQYTIRLTREPTETQAAFNLVRPLKTGTKPNQLIEIQLDPESRRGTSRDPRDQKAISNTNQAPAGFGDLVDSPLSKTEWQSLSKIADEYFFNEDSANQLLQTHPQAVRDLAWNRYLKSDMARGQKSDFDKNQVTFQKHLSPYTIKEVGQRPENGWPLIIAMHGGGNASQRLNDSQWKHMQIYYKDQPDVTGYKYLALRAPNNTWNGFYDDYVYPLIENLIRQFVTFGDVDPNKVFIMGYSHGGYGAFAIGPKIPDRFAAVHASAAAPTDGQTSAKTLRNTRFTFMVGENDKAYGRRERCEKFAEQIKQLQAENPGDYPVEFMFQPGFGHGGLPDRDMIGQMYDHVRNPVPKQVTWEMTDSVVDRFFWLAVDEPQRGSLIDATIVDNTIEVKTENCKSFSIFLDRRLIDPDQPIEIKIDEQNYSVAYQPSFQTLCESIAKSGDVNLAFDFEIKIDLDSDD